MSSSRYVYLSILLASTFTSPAEAMHQTLGIPNYDFSLDTHTYAPTPRPAPLSNSFKTVGVCFLGHGDCNISIGKDNDKDGDYEVNTAKQCTNEGFIANNCNEVQVPTGYCPYNSSYIKGCKCDPNLIACPAGQVGVGTACGGKYRSCKCDPNLISCSAKEDGIGATCGGKYQSCICKSKYKYTSSNCTSPRFVSGDSCDGKYTGCVCPSGVSSGTYGCKTYYGSPCSSVCKEAYTDNCHNRTAKTCTYGCKSNYSDCSSKCETCYTDNCRNRTAVSCTYGCAAYFSDCSSKCKTCATDPCAGVTCGSNAYCSSGSCYCNSGYSGDANTGCTSNSSSGGSSNSHEVWYACDDGRTFYDYTTSSYTCVPELHNYMYYPACGGYGYKFDVCD